jgi:hypothetical protein
MKHILNPTRVKNLSMVCMFLGRSGTLGTYVCMWVCLRAKCMYLINNGTNKNPCITER